MTQTQAISQLRTLVQFLKTNTFPKQGLPFLTIYFLSCESFWSVFSADRKNQRGILPAKWLKGKAISAFKYTFDDEEEIFTAVFSPEKWREFVQNQQKLEQYFKDKYPEVHQRVWDAQKIATPPTAQRSAQKTIPPTTPKTKTSSAVIPPPNQTEQVVNPPPEPVFELARSQNPASVCGELTNANQLVQVLSQYFIISDRQRKEDQTQLFKFFQDTQQNFLEHTRQESEKTRQMIGSCLGKRNCISEESPPSKHSRIISPSLVYE